MRLIDKDELTSTIKHLIEQTQKMYGITARNFAVSCMMRVEEAPVIDIVQCKDCIHKYDGDCPIEWPKTDDDYCSYGERNEK